MMIMVKIREDFPEKNTLSFGPKLPLAWNLVPIMIVTAMMLMVT